MELSLTTELHPAPSRAPLIDGARHARRYAIISELGGGGMSTVHLAHDRVTGRVVAIKRIAESAAALPGATHRFAREASIVAQLRHPNIVETVAIEREGETATAIVTEYVRGASLRDMLASAGALPIDRIVRVLRDVASALAYTHARNIVHRDVKPANILVESDTKRALLADFGIACESGACADVGDGLTIGTPAYMAPEQIDGRAVDARADVYALCVVGWEMLAGRMPWMGAPLADVLHRQCYEPLPDLAQIRPDIPVYLLRAIDGGLAKDPAMRWRDGAALLHALSPRPTPLEWQGELSGRGVASAAASAAGPAAAPLDATVRMETLDPPAAPVSARPERARRVRLLATTVGTVAVAVALGGLAPQLSRATATARPRIDPELDSMLTLAVASHPTNAPAPRHAVPAGCKPGTSTNIAHCAATIRRSAKARTRVRHRRR